MYSTLASRGKGRSARLTGATLNGGATLPETFALTPEWSFGSLRWLSKVRPAKRTRQGKAKGTGKEGKPIKKILK